jgi:hypothetical protein
VTLIGAGRSAPGERWRDSCLVASAAWSPAGSCSTRSWCGASLAPLLDGLDIALRDAKAHEDHLIEGDELILTDCGSRRPQHRVHSRLGAC